MAERRSLVAVALAVAFIAASCGGAVGDSGPSEPDRSAPAGGGAGGSAPDDDLRVPTAGWKTDFSKHSVPLSEFLGGGPGKDGIPAIDAPRFVSVADADGWLESREPVAELEVGGEARAYPLQILIWHEIVNDTVGGVPVAVTFCPLCNTTVVFDRRVGGRTLDFGTTGNLRNSDLVMYDRQSESWWQQFGGEAVVGEHTGETLEKLPARIVAWDDFARAHPDGKVLSRDTGFGRPYGQNPYVGYDDIDSPPFIPSVANLDDDRLPPKERVVLIERREEIVVVPFSTLAEAQRVEVEVGGEQLEVTWKPGARSALDSSSIAEGREVGSADVRSLESGERVVFDLPFWFSVAAFVPDAKIVRP